VEVPAQALKRLKEAKDYSSVLCVFFLLPTGRVLDTESIKPQTEQSVQAKLRIRACSSLIKLFGSLPQSFVRFSASTSSIASPNSPPRPWFCSQLSYHIGFYNVGIYIHL
jgi:hypothetical protein